MDPLEIIGNLDRVKPAYQPIFSAITHSITGYELLGRFYNGNEWISLAEFFHDVDVPEEFKVEVDQHLLHIALSELLESEQDTFLCVNRSAKELLVNNGEDLLETLQTFEKKGFAMNRVVIEVAEQDFNEDFENIHHLLLYYKTFGIQLAIDHVGAKTANIDRIRQLEPHILKINTRIIIGSQSGGFQDIMYSLSLLAHRIGAALLFENIEDDFLQYYAWKNGGRYYQGYYLAKPTFDLGSMLPFNENISGKVIEYIEREKKLIEERLGYILSWEEKLKVLLPQWKALESVDGFIEVVTNYFNEESFRMYICDSNGKQISANFRKLNDTWKIETEKLGSNWAFRPYFLENMMQMKTRKTGILSDLYSDIETRELIRTFSYPLSSEDFLFIDIRYTFLYDHECLLI
ncbi:putative EAL-domain containing protein YkuI [Paraliobacillus quinghaiensis]|uniref:EAL-domain containing protein YkuI n=1 Tax=Paraliobacillus quinghaiensis TaxID=470815 RepID=A0A917WPF8_9BACI|nr:EAL-associated domain-containing protein [Paraliobacillus quinghaiensis]GGM19150.1 putative EAL-domain containing protein YkuI [Paraliobacillus quinghaiensis]